MNNLEDLIVLNPDESTTCDTDKDTPTLNWDMPDEKDILPTNPFEAIIKTYQAMIFRAETVGMIPEQVPLLMVRANSIEQDIKDCLG